MKIEENLLQTHSRANSYQLLSQCYFPPDEDLLVNLKNRETSSGEGFWQLAQHIPGQDALEILKSDFSRLFIGPFKMLAVPYGSVYLENSGKLMGNSTVDVRRFYQQQGLEISLKEVPDHIALELEFVYYLTTREIAAFKNNDTQDAANWREKQLLFLDRYLGSWVPEFAQAVEKGASVEFYRALAQITRSVVHDDLIKPRLI